MYSQIEVKIQNDVQHEEKIKPLIIFIISILFPLPCSISVLVTKSPSSLLLPGEILSLDCSVEAPQGHRKPEIYWLDPQGKKIANNEGPFKVTAKGQHNGQWTCVVRNDRTEHKATVSVTVVGEFLCTCMHAFVLQLCTIISIITVISLFLFI